MRWGFKKLQSIPGYVEGCTQCAEFCACPGRTQEGSTCPPLADLENLQKQEMKTKALL